MANRFARMVPEYYVARLRQIMTERRGRLARVRTRRDAERYVAAVREAARRCFGPMPGRTPLNPVVTGRDEYARYFLEKVHFESRPGLRVTGNVYVPKMPSKRYPAVLGLCGHDPHGKACNPYQMFCQGLASKGFLVLIIDPIHQGERLQYFTSDGFRKKAIPPLCWGHNLMGNQMALAGDFFGAWRVWDAIRALDYLVSRPDVDAARLGVTGNSGGGTLTTYLTALDSRPLMAAPGCFICSKLANIENELPCDVEQNPPGLLAEGLDEVDLLLCYAPRPTLIMAQHDDFFDERFTRQAYDELQRIHALLGGRGTAAYFAGPTGHGFGKENREAMYRFFMRQVGVRGDWHEPRVKAFEPARLWVTPRGRWSPAESRRVFEFTAATARALARRRGTPSARVVRGAARRLLNLPSAGGAPHYRVTHAGAPLQFAVETEPGIQAVVTVYGQLRWTMHPPRGRVTVYVGHLSSGEDVRRIPWVRGLTAGGRTLVTVDPRGIGQSRAMPFGPEDFLAPYGMDFMYAANADMLGESCLGRRVFDVLRVLDFLRANGADDVRLIGRGCGAVVAAFAALLHRSRPRIALYDYLPSYHLLTQAPNYAWPFSILLRGVLRQFDLPDVYRVLGPCLMRARPWNAMMKTVRN